MSWTWPQPLPKPEADGDTLTFEDVLPDVDLKVKAGPAGFSSLLVVKTAEAAADPALKQVDFDLDTNGLAVEDRRSRQLHCGQPGRRSGLDRADPLMWDSSTASAPAAPAARSTRSAPVGPPPPSDEFEPAHGAQQAAMGISVTGGKLRLTPDQKLLTAGHAVPGAAGPAVSGPRHSWTIAYKKHPNSSFFNGANWDNGTTTARVGTRTRPTG
ncbi:Lipoprotein OS=Streptomyces microflavus OX=1919 GN=Smic_45660 PE=4 SV=1 [Streptomyces microflavus]